MKCKTKLMMMCISMILIPLLLTCLTFVSVGRYMVKKNYDLRQEITQEVLEQERASAGAIAAFLEQPLNGFESLIAPTFFKSMIFAIVVILVLTSIMLSLWLHKSMISPINELNVAMNHIKNGNFYIYGKEHLVRGYEEIVNKLISLGCYVEEEDED